METINNKYSKKVSNLTKKRYVARPIHRKGGWLPPGHDSAFMNDGSTLGIVVPVMQGNVLSDPFKGLGFTNDDKTILVNDLGIGDLQQFNIHVKGSYWRGKTVSLDRNGLFLNLSKSEDLIKYLILRSDSERIAPSWNERFNKGTYKFALVEEGEEVQDKVSNLEEKKNAYLYFNKMDSNISKMKDFLFVYYLTKKDAKRPPNDATIEWLKNEIGRIIEDDLKIFLSIISDVDYTIKLLIQKSVSIGALNRDKHNYSFPGADRPVGTIEDLIEHLDDEKNQDAKMKLMHQVDNAK